ncbi:MAG: hypothetical protein IGS03_13915 [Candidatus Sericytochromatia bacterium]|nr:hypothetical protein [Candidatus Sericytochromatia bacterium]
MVFFRVCLAFLLFSSPAWAATQPGDRVVVIRAEDAALNWQRYEKPFKELKLDARTLAFIRRIEGELKDAEYNADTRFRLTHLRLVANQVQALIFANAYGDTVLRYLDQPESGCDLTFSGNGFSRCFP